MKKITEKMTLVSKEMIIEQTEYLERRKCSFRTFIMFSVIGDFDAQTYIICKTGSFTQLWIRCVMVSWFNWNDSQTIMRFHFNAFPPAPPAVLTSCSS